MRRAVSLTVYVDQDDEHRGVAMEVYADLGDLAQRFLSRGYDVDTSAYEIPNAEPISVDAQVVTFPDEGGPTDGR